MFRNSQNFITMTCVAFSIFSFLHVLETILLQRLDIFNGIYQKLVSFGLTRAISQKHLLLLVRKVATEKKSSSSIECLNKVILYFDPKWILFFLFLKDLMF